MTRDTDMDTTPREYLRKAIDDEIKSLEGSIRALRHQRNALAPISSLPTEVILTIFSLMHAPGTSRGTSSHVMQGEESDCLAWLRMAHVCHQWREIALNQPLFWSHVNFTTVSPAGAAEILARAKSVPLHLEADVSSRCWDDARVSTFQKELQDHISHIRHLDISAEYTQLKRTLDSLTSLAPALEFLSLTREYPNRTIETQGFIPDTLFDGSTPRLSCLELYNCAINWESPLLRGLKRLNINSPFQRPSPLVWLDALGEMPQLETPTLLDASPSAPPDTSRDVELTVTLPSLTLFDLSSSVRDCVFALAHLVVPALATLCLTADSYYPDGSDARELLPYVSRHADGPQHTKPLQSVFVRSNSQRVEIYAWTAPDININAESSDMDFELPNAITTLDTMPSLQAEFSVTSGDWSPWTRTELFDTAMASLPLDSLVTLAVQKTTRLDKQFWLGHVQQWPLLRCMQLGSRAASGLIEALLEDNDGRESPLFPLLTKLVLFDTTLSPPSTLRLCDVLMNRVEQSVPLDTLDLRTCRATCQAVELLSEIVTEVLGPEGYLEEAA